MDTKSTKNRWVAVLLCLLMMAAGAAGLVGLAPVYYEQRWSGNEALFNGDYFLRLLATSNYTLYWRAQEEWQGSSLLPSDVYYPAAAQEQEQPQNSDPAAEESPDEGEDDGDGRTFSSEMEERSVFDQTLYNWDAQVSEQMEGLLWAVIDDATGKVYTNGADLTDLWQEGRVSPAAQEEYQYFLALQFDGSGAQMPVDFYGEGGDYILAAHQEFLWSFRMGEYSLDRLTEDEFHYAPPRNVTILYAVPRAISGDAGIGTLAYWSDLRNFMSTGYGTAMVTVTLAVAGFALLLTFKRSWALGQGAAARLPVELAIAGGFITLFSLDGIFEFAFNVMRGSVSRWLVDIASVDDLSLAGSLACLLLGAAFFAVLGLAVFCTLSLSNLFSQGPAAYLGRHSLIVRFCRWIGRGLRRLWAVGTRVDLTDSATKTLLRLLAVNFVVLTLCCCAWFFGILGLAAYTVILFFVLRKRFGQIQRDYRTLLAATGKMAQGDLDLRIEEDLGVFDPLKEEFNKVQSGFKKAVETEVRSRNMKTELITNVSHDLKTPLTAIITYVDLLKDESLTEEQRRSYVETLDKKSQRLKRLIEDLFEVSKAASGNVTLHFAEVDLAALLKQVEYELEDKIAASGIDFRWNLPDHRVPLRLDGQRSCRIFENLIVNITKYGMPHTRAYIDLTEEEEAVTVTFKNISADELDFGESEIVERFARGDKARNTEGSGLGLAIAKSFTELQGGRFAVHVDGDLFKAELVWPNDANAGREDLE